MTTFTNIIPPKTSFTTYADSVFIKSLSLSSFKIFFLINGYLITKTSKRTASQRFSSGGKGLTTRWKLNGKAISASDLNDLLKSESYQDVIYSSECHEIKKLMK